VRKTGGGGGDATLFESRCRCGGGGGGGRESFRMSGRPRTTSFAEGNKPPANPPLGGMKISSKYHNLTFASQFLSLFLFLSFSVRLDNGFST
jgi:hypothetical protein